MQRHSTANTRGLSFRIPRALCIAHSALCIAFAALAANADIHLNAAAIGGANNGTSWSNAYTNLAEAVNALNAAPAGGRTLRVAQGFYIVEATLAITVADFAIEGGYAAASDGDLTRDTELYRSVFTADLTLNDCYRPSRPGDYGAIQIAVNGLRIVQNGKLFLPEAPYSGDERAFAYQLFRQNGVSAANPAVSLAGGASGVLSGIAFYGFSTTVVSIAADAGTMALSDCLFAYNSEPGCISSAASATSVANCRFLFNATRWAAIVGLSSNSRVENCLFQGNVGVIANSAEFFVFTGTNNLVRGCTMENNLGYVAPGFTKSAFVCYAASGCGGTFDSCLFSNNVAAVSNTVMTDNPSFFTMLGGGVVTNCVFTDNQVHVSAAKDGGYALISPMYSGAHALTLADCLFIRNTIASPNVQAASGSYVLGVVGNNYNGLALTVRNCVFDDNDFSYAEVDGVTPILVRGAFTKATSAGTTALTFVNNTVTGPRRDGVLDILQYGTGHTQPLKVYNSLFLYDGDILDNLFSASVPALWNVRNCAIQNLAPAYRPVDIDVADGLTTDPVPLDTTYAPASRVPGLDVLYTADDAVPAYETIRGAIQTLPPAVASSHYLVARRNPLAGGTVSLPAQAVANGAAIAPVSATPASAANSFLGWYTADANGEPDTLLTSETTLSAATVPAMTSLTADTIVIASFGQPQVAITFDLGAGGTFDGTGAHTAVVNASEGDAFPAVPDWTPDPAWHFTGWLPSLPTAVPGEATTYRANYVSSGVRVIRVVPSADQEPGVEQDGLSWATAYTDIATAYRDAGIWRGEVWLKEGTYILPAEIPVLSQVAVRGGFAGTETAADEADPVLHPTIISADVNGDDAWKPLNTSTAADWVRVRDTETGAFNTPNPNNDVDYWRTGGNTTDNRSRCFVAEDYAVTNVAFSGLTFTGFKSGTIYVAKGGEAIRLDDCRFIACGTTTAPAVVNVIDAPATIEGCEFTGCYCSMRLQSATADHVFTVTNCLFDANFGENFGASFFFGPYQGKNNSRLILADTRFTRNADTTINSSGSASLTIWSNGSALVSDCAFVSNRVVGTCTANILLVSGPRADFVRCRFTDNVYKSSNGGAATIGGALSKLTLHDSYFGRNTATASGTKRAAILTAGCNMCLFANTTFERNALLLAEGATGHAATIALGSHNASLAMVNCLVADNGLPDGEADLDFHETDTISYANCPLWFVNTVFWNAASNYKPVELADKSLPLQVQNAAMKNLDTNAFTSVYSDVGLDTSTNPLLSARAKTGPNGAVARGLSAASPFAKAGCRTWFSEEKMTYYIYDAARKRYHSLDRNYTYASNVPQDDDPIPPDAFGRPRTEGRIAYGPLNTAPAGTTLTLR